MAERARIGQAAAQAWRDTIAAIRALTGPTPVVLVILVALALARSLVAPTTESPERMLFDFAFSCAQAFLLTPYLIAVHRYVILNEQTPRYLLALGEHRFQLFFMWSVALSLTYWLPSFALARVAKIQPSLPLAVLTVALIVALFVSVIISLRLIILFPAIAVDAPGATWANTMADTRGNAWRIFFIGAVTTLPLVAVAIAAAFFLWNAELFTASPSLLSRVVGSIAEGASTLLGFTLAVVVASRLYKELGNRVNQPE
jgi:hypothetical protein